MARRWCLSLISSAMSIRTALGLNSSLSFHIRLAKAVLSEVPPCRMMATVLPSGNVTAASIGMALYHRKRRGKATSDRAEASR